MHSKPVVSVMLVVAAGLLAASFTQGVNEGLPSVALDWLFGLRLLRALGAFAILAILAMVLIRGWGGLWPQRISASSVDFPAIEQEVTKNANEVSLAVRALIREVASEIEALGQDAKQ